MTDHTPKYFYDGGTEINPDLILKPDLCVSCEKEGLGTEEEILCNLTRADQQGCDEFVCDAYIPIKSQTPTTAGQ
jgi:hypothetical protein